MLLTMPAGSKACSQKPAQKPADNVHGIVSRVSLRIVFFEVGEACLCEHLCVASLHLFSQSLTNVLPCGGLHGAECHLQLLDRLVYSVARLALIKLSCRCVTEVMLLHCLCCTRLIRTRIIVCSVSFHLLLSEFAISSCCCSSSIRVLSIKV